MRPGDRVGFFAVLDVIGHGGMGSVYLAEQKEPVQRRVELKVIKLGMDTRAELARGTARPFPCCARHARGWTLPANKLTKCGRS